ncbi:ABC transporter ATP-binding protein [Cellulomonas bogoriensis]|uniref:Multidrug ABC transporter ATPase n=1 Tax=Cellulomonas bogoriensis 69B4 = DSM 16987 TaxID=1386082 RepID=A0A0A0C3P6_9CELL|nr:ABC transporter ATP-binding protein [Cellulomonas bogoriensis]KGM14004.1 multidrug ABC transporter ATPase [Cellulomonas bogoriensis 69B4 = DSM 16987]
MRSPALRIDGLTRRFGPVTANDDVCLTVRAGEVVGLLGHNGAGKTTLVSQVVGLLRPDSGSITVGDVDAVAHPGEARRRVALQAQSQAPIDGLTPRAAIEIAGRIRGLTGAQARSATERVAEELDITPWLDRRALPEGRGLSGGVRRLTAFAMAVVAPTGLVVLDEPTNDVDAARRRALWAAVRRLGDEGAGVLLVTHNVAEAERVVDELVVLDHGRVVASGTPAALRGAEDTDLRLELHLHPDGPDPSAQAQPPFPVTRRVRSGRRVLLTVPSHAASTAVTWAGARRDDGTLDGFTLGPATLEDAYLAATGTTTTDTDTDTDTDGTAVPTVTEEPTRA